jgi:hypothetical protein
MRHPFPHVIMTLMNVPVSFPACNLSSISLRSSTSHNSYSSVYPDPHNDSNSTRPHPPETQPPPRRSATTGTRRERSSTKSAPTPTPTPQPSPPSTTKPQQAFQKRLSDMARLTVADQLLLSHREVSPAKRAILPTNKDSGSTTASFRRVPSPHSPRCTCMYLPTMQSQTRPRTSHGN